MSSDPEDPLQLRVEAARLKGDQIRMEFLRADLDACLTFADLAETSLRTGNRGAAERTIASAEKGYTMILQYMSDPKYANRMSDAERRQLTAGLERLRARLDDLRLL